MTSTCKISTAARMMHSLHVIRAAVLMMSYSLSLVMPVQHRLSFHAVGEVELRVGKGPERDIEQMSMCSLTMMTLSRMSLAMKMTQLASRGRQKLQIGQKDTEEMAIRKIE